MIAIETRSKGVSDVFKAYPYSVFEFFAKAGQGIYVPAYQRPYSWDKSNILRLIEDVSHGFRMLVSQPDTVTFLGTIIAINDTQHKTISPLVKGQVPSRVMTIIDGQQRLSTLLVINTVLHDQLRVAARKLNADKPEEQWLLQEVQRQLAELSKTFEEDQGYGEGGFRFYPRMIRSFVDQWSTQAQFAYYKSPLALHLYKYGEHVRATEQQAKKFTLQVPIDTGDEQLLNAHQGFVERVKAVQKGLRTLEEGPAQDDEGLEIPEWDDVVQNAAFQQALGNQAIFPIEVQARLKNSEDGFHRTLRILLFSRFLLSRVALTIVEATNEDSAFDLFEALNTTGEPLTAYETFKPKVIQQETLEDFERSESYKHLKSIDEYLSDFRKTDEKQDATRNLVVSFALAETGEKLSRHLSDQRRYLRDRYEAIESKEDKLCFVQHLARSANFYRQLWPREPSGHPAFGEFETSVSDLSRICADFLRQSNHTITISPLIRFYSSALDARLSADVNQQKAAIRELEEAMRAIAAFWALWRSSRPGTDSIDSYYRGLMQHVPNGDPEAMAERYISLARRPAHGGQGVTPNSTTLKKALREILKIFGKIEDKSSWVQRAAEQDASKTKAVTRFVLLTALHDSPADLATPGLNEKGTTGSVTLLNFDIWRALGTIEHIAPDKPEHASDWDPQIYKGLKGDLVNTLGNLTLLPHSINASVSNRSWRSKHYLYSVLASSSQQSMEQLLVDAGSYGVTMPTTQLLQAKSTYMAQIDALSKVADLWTADLVTQRSKRLAELAWGKYAEWLEWA